MELEHIDEAIGALNRLLPNGAAQERETGRVSRRPGRNSLPRDAGEALN